MAVILRTSSLSPGLPGLTTLPTVAALEDSPVGDVETQVGFACLGVGAVAVEASVREYRPDIALEIDGLGTVGGRELGIGAPRIKTSSIPTICSPPYPIINGLIMILPKAIPRPAATVRGGILFPRAAVKTELDQRNHENRGH